VAPAGKTLETLDRARLPRQVAAKLDELSTGDFLERAQNVLCFGLLGRGKTHAAAALGHALVQRGHSVLFSPTFRLVTSNLVFGDWDRIFKNPMTTAAAIRTANPH
jgi:DNA replication protein DnaC